MLDRNSQNIAKLQNKLNAAREKQKKAIARATFVIGAAVMSAAQQDTGFKQQILLMLNRLVKAPRDRKVIEDFVKELKTTRTFETDNSTGLEAYFNEQ